MTAAAECRLEEQAGRGHASLRGLAAGGKCSLLLRRGEHTALLTGPVDRRGERRLLRELGRSREVDLLVAPRGGQGRSSQLGFIEALSPVVSVIAPPDWYQGEAGAPALERYEKADTRVLFTPRTGELRLLPEEGGWRVEPARDCGQKVRLC